MLNFDKESIKVVKGSGDSTGAIKVNGTLTIVGLADEFFKNLIFVISFVFLASLAYADSHDTQQTIIDKAKEINKKVKEKQALQNSNISSEIGKEEALPLNDPFVGDGSLGGGTGIKLVAETEEEKKNLSVFNFKLIGIVQGKMKVLHQSSMKMEKL